MKKIFLSLALTALLGFTATMPATACEGGKCKMEHKESDKNAKSKKSKKAAAKAESCHAPASVKGATTGTAAAETKSCCMKKEAAMTEATQEAVKQ